MHTIPNIPILEHFRLLNLSVPSHFNQSMMLSASRRLNVFTFKASLGILCQYHDMLRAVWDGRQLSVRDTTAANLFHLEEHNLRSNANINTDMLPLCESLQSSIDITSGPMMRVAVFHLPDKDAVLMVIHHLVVDGVSWRIIIEDLNKIYSTLLQGKLSVGLPKRRCSFVEYARALNGYAGCSELLNEEPYWQEVADKIKSIGTVTPDPADKTTDLPFSLDAVKFRDADINALLLTALSRAWKEVMGQNTLSIALEGHGREPFGQHPLSLERLVGWFTSIYPVALCYDDDPRKHVAAVQDMLRAIPNKGLGYGVLTRIAHKENLESSPLMTFNYLGSFEEGGISDSILTIDNTLPQGNSVSLDNKPDTPLAINCTMAYGTLTGALTYGKDVLDDTQAQKLCDAFVTGLRYIIKPFLDGN